MNGRKVFYLAIPPLHRGQVSRALRHHADFTLKDFFMSLHSASHRLNWLVASLLTLLLSACASNTPVSRQQYDFGPLPVVANAVSPSNPAGLPLQISLADINAPAALDSNAMLYRLQYDNVQQLKPYAQHRWSMSPSALLAQRLKAQIAAGDGHILSTSDGTSQWPLLRIDLDEFAQIFTSASSSYAAIDVRASVFKGRLLIGQRRFVQHLPAATADAPGGAKAMQQASDALIADLRQWIQGLPLK